MLAYQHALLLTMVRHSCPRGETLTCPSADSGADAAHKIFWARSLFRRLSGISGTGAEEKVGA